MIYDVHHHIDFANNIADSVAFFRSVGAQHDVEKWSLQAIPILTNLRKCPIENLKVLTAKAMMQPDAFAFMGLWYGDAPTGDDLLAQLKKGLTQGFDGVKLLEGHPALRKHLGFGLDAPIYDKFFDYLEEQELPIMLHDADPEDSWDIRKVSPYALEHGRFYGGEGFLSKDEHYAEVERRLAKNPRLQLCLAHFFFLSADLDRAADFLDRHPTVRFDVTPGKEMFRNFSQNPAKARAFFEQYRHRILFGTDVNNSRLDIQRYFGEVYDLVLKSLFGTEEFPLWGNTYTPLGLDETVKARILRQNADEWQGETPKAICRDAVTREIRRMNQANTPLNDDDARIFAEIKAYWGV